MCREMNPAAQDNSGSTLDPGLQGQQLLHQVLGQEHGAGAMPSLDGTPDLNLQHQQQLAPLLVGGLLESHTEADLLALFGKYGAVQDCWLFRDSQTGHSLCCAMLSYASKQEADAAVQALHQQAHLPESKQALQVQHAHNHQDLQFVVSDAGTHSAAAVTAAAAVAAPEEQKSDSTGSRQQGVTEAASDVDGSEHGSARSAAEDGDYDYDDNDDDAQVGQLEDGQTQQEQGGQQPETFTLFFAKVPRTASQAQVQELFNRFGTVLQLELFIEYPGAPTSKGCGLAVYGCKAAAQAAVEALCNQYTWQGMRSPMVVKLITSPTHKVQDKNLPYRPAGSHNKQQARAPNTRHGKQSPAAQDSRVFYRDSAAAGQYQHQPYAGAGSSRSIQQQQEFPPRGCAPDAYKLFVGNLPAGCTESALRSVLECIGPVVQLGLLHDRHSREPKGCGFVWYATGQLADKAVEQLNLRVALPGSPTGNAPSTAKPLILRRASHHQGGAAAAAAQGRVTGNVVQPVQLQHGQYGQRQLPPMAAEQQPVLLQQQQQQVTLQQQQQQVTLQQQQQQPQQVLLQPQQPQQVLLHVPREVTEGDSCYYRVPEYADHGVFATATATAAAAAAAAGAMQPGSYAGSGGEGLSRSFSNASSSISLTRPSSGRQLQRLASSPNAVPVSVAAGAHGMPPRMQSPIQTAATAGNAAAAAAATYAGVSVASQLPGFPALQVGALGPNSSGGGSSSTGAAAGLAQQPHLLLVTDPALYVQQQQQQQQVGQVQTVLVVSQPQVTGGQQQQQHLDYTQQQPDIAGYVEQQHVQQLQQPVYLVLQSPQQQQPQQQWQPEPVQISALYPVPQAATGVQLQLQQGMQSISLSDSRPSQQQQWQQQQQQPTATAVEPAPTSVAAAHGLSYTMGMASAAAAAVGGSPVSCSGMLSIPVAVGPTAGVTTGPGSFVTVGPTQGPTQGPLVTMSLQLSPKVPLADCLAHLGPQLLKVSTLSIVDISMTVAGNGDVVVKFTGSQSQVTAAWQLATALLQQSNVAYVN